MKAENIQNHINTINELLDWNVQYGNGTFSVQDLYKERRRLKVLKKSVEGKCCAAAYGISQVGKSYLMSSLLSTPESSFMVSIGKKDYDFITQINPSGSHTGKTESTGIITRFTTDKDDATSNGLVKITMLTPLDIVLMLVDAYYNDVKQSIDSAYTASQINDKLIELSQYWSNHTYHQDFIVDDDIKDMSDYFKEVLQTKIHAIATSKYFEVVANNIQYVRPQHWEKIFGVLWNDNKDISFVFHHIIEEYEKLQFVEYAYVPIEAILSKNGTLLDVTLLDKVCDKENGIQYAVETTNVLSATNQIIASNFSKYYLAALIAEVTLQLPKSVEGNTDKTFLKDLDLLDFPGARSRKEIPEDAIDSNELAEILRRGKVAYLFNKYSRSLKIGVVLFCHDDDQSEVSPISSAIEGWIKEYIAKTPAERTEVLKATNGISPLFFIGTKFNKELKATDADSPDAIEFLDNHWNRFNQVIPGVVQPGRWLDDWVIEGSTFRSKYFQSIYLLRDYAYSKDFFEGFDRYKGQTETSFKNPSNFPNYYDCLKNSFLRNEFVKRHFANPEQVWNEVATPNHDGSLTIIRDLNKIAPLLEEAREQKYLRELKHMQQRLLNILTANYILDTDDGRNEKLKKVVTTLQFKLDKVIGKNPEKFGCIIDDLMIKPRDIYSIAYDIIVLRRQTPKIFSEIGFIRQRAGILDIDNRDSRIQKLCACYQVKNMSELEELLYDENYTIDDIVSTEIENQSTQASIIARNVFQFWGEHINTTMQHYSSLFPYTDEFAKVIISNFKTLGILQCLVEKIQFYQERFSQDACINAIADYVSLTLNHYVSSIGYTSYSKEMLSLIEAKAKTCDIEIHLGEEDNTSVTCSLIEALSALEESTGIQSGTCSTDALSKLPFWANYQLWLKYIVSGFIYAENIIVCDKEANDKIKQMIDKCQNLY